MGAGKSSVGRACAERLGRAFVDLDHVIEAGAGASVADIFAAEGERGFRTRERTALVDVCASPEPLVIGCGGGTVVEPENRAMLRDAAFVVWLRADPAVLAARVSGATANRPLLVSGAPPIFSIERLAALRQDAYAAVADAVIDTEALTVTESADAVVAAFEGAPG